MSLAEKPVRTFSENNLVSFMGRASYTLMDKYIMNIAVRRDGSSRFGKKIINGVHSLYSFSMAHKSGGVECGIWSPAGENKLSAQQALAFYSKNFL